jgi:hypothetical protein
LDEQHQQLHALLLEVERLMALHFENEAKEFVLRTEHTLPPNHPSIWAAWDRHRVEHETMLSRLKVLHQDFLTHIREVDKKHFHPL